MPLTVTDCIAAKNSITITFSDTVVSQRKPTAADKPKAKALWPHSALNPANYTISNPSSPAFTPPVILTDTKILSLDPGTNTLTITTGPFHAGDWVTIAIRNVEGEPEAGDPKRPGLEGGFVMISRQVAGTGQDARVTKNVEDAIAYPILTEEVGSAPSPVARLGSGGSRPSGGGACADLGMAASQAVADILGWKPNASDPKSFIGALTQSFTLTDVEGHIESAWNQRTYTVQTDLAGGITGAQASLYTRAKDAQDNVLPLLDGLYALNPTADPEYVDALRDIAKSQVTEIVKQFGVVPPSVLRINTYFKILLGASNLAFDPPSLIEADPDKIGGTLGSIRDIYGIYFMKGNKDNPYSNSVKDEEDITNFRVVSDYMTSLLQSWLSNGKYFTLSTGNMPAFLGTQLILISRQLSVIAETVNEVRFALNSVFIGPNERQTLLVEFPDGLDLPAMFLEDVLNEIESSVSDELPRLLKGGGRIAINNNLLPVVQTMMNMVQGAKAPVNFDELPDGFSTARVKRTLDDLSDQLTQLFTQGQQVGMQIPSPKDSLTI